MTDPPALPPAFGGVLGDPYLHQQMLDQRRIMVAGPLDGEAVASVTAQLLVLDGDGSSPVAVVVNSPGGPLDEVFALVDLVRAMRSTVDVACIGSAMGTAVALVAAATGDRRAARHARFSMRLAREDPSARADLVRHAERRKALEERYIALLAAVTDLTPARIESEIVSGKSYSAEQAVELGLVDAVLR